MNSYMYPQYNADTSSKCLSPEENLFKTADLEPGFRWFFFIYKQHVWQSGKSAHIWPAWEVEQFMLVGDRGLVLQFPHHYADEVGVLDDNRHLLEHMLKANIGFLQAAVCETGQGRKSGKRKVNRQIAITWGYRHVTVNCKISFYRQLEIISMTHSKCWKNLINIHVWIQIT